MNLLEELTKNYWIEDLCKAKNNSDYEKTVQAFLSSFCICPAIERRLSESITSTNANEITEEKQELVIKKPEIIKIRPKIVEPERVRPVFPRSRKASIPQIDKSLKTLYKRLWRRDYTFSSRIKTSRGLHNGVSSRRSKFVGVSKNRNHYQTLITIHKSKKYIGTYCSEEEAAMTYDFYAFGLHGVKAKTNFEYTGEEVKEMIEVYFDSDSTFEASKFIKKKKMIS